MTDKVAITQRQMLDRILAREEEMARCIAELTRMQSKQFEQLDRLIEFERRLLAHVERMGRALEQARMMQLRRGPFNSRREDR